MNQKGFTKQFLKLMDQLEKSCCSGNNLFGIPTDNTPSILFSGKGTVYEPLQASVQLSQTTGNTVVLLPDGIFSSGGLTKVYSQNTTGVLISGDGNICYTFWVCNIKDRNK